ncbi:MAG TPA: nicotinamide-nucleotide amidohydrolase family protein, partial [Sphingobacteriaceae bacterium]|nr:nicotinamide-nucleotide amidohydrolase family protein [Sphingobacteriaceae bacterium]
VLEKADVLFNSLGTAPGMWIAHKNKHYVILPGVPFEMKHLMLQTVLPRLSFFEDRLPVVHQTLLIAGIGESFLAEKLEAIERNLPSNVHLAYLPQPGLVRLRLTAIGSDEEVIIQKCTYYAGLIREAAGKHYIASGDMKLEEAVLDLLKNLHCTLSTAESCTGGNIARSITQIPGSSQVFMGSAVTYSNASKEALVQVLPETLEQFGAVSEETVREMAIGSKALFNTDYAISVSGIAGPDGGSASKPVGTVWIGVAGKTKIITKLYKFGNDRSANIDRASAAALYELFVLAKEENNP